MNRNTTSASNNYPIYDPILVDDFEFDFTDEFYGNQPTILQKSLDFSSFEPSLSGNGHGHSVKKHRKTMEKNRRDQLNSAIDSFRDLIPPEIVYEKTAKTNDSISRHQLVDCTIQYIDILRQTVLDHNQFLILNGTTCPISTTIAIEALIAGNKSLKFSDRVNLSTLSSMQIVHQSIPELSVTDTTENLQLVPNSESSKMYPKPTLVHADHLKDVADSIKRLSDNLKVMYMMLKDSPNMSYWIRTSMERCRDLTNDALEFVSFNTNK